MNIRMSTAKKLSGEIKMLPAVLHLVLYVYVMGDIVDSTAFADNTEAAQRENK